MKTNQPEHKIVLSFEAQQYGLTVEDLIEQGYKREEIHVETQEESESGKFLQFPS